MGWLHADQVAAAVVGSMSCLIWTPPKLVPLGTNFSEIIGPVEKHVPPWDRHKD